MNREDLLDSIRKAPDDPAPYLVFADWLTAQGDPWGELIRLQHRIAEGDESLADRAKELLVAHQQFVGGIDPELFTLEWRWGFIEMARFFNYRDWMDGSFDVSPIVRQVCESPASELMRELRIGVIRWMENAEDVPNILKQVASLGRAGGIDTIRLGDVYDIDCDLAHHPLGELGVLGEQYPALRSLRVRGCDFTFGVLPQGLIDLRIETCGLSREDLASITQPRWQSLSSLVLWFGSGDYGCDCGVGDLDRLLDGSAIPAVTELALANAEFADELCSVLHGASVLRQLERLDLSMGTMSGDGVAALLQNPGAFDRLKALDVSDNFLSEAQVEELRSALKCEVISTEQKEDDEPEWRYVTAYE